MDENTVNTSQESTETTDSFLDGWNEEETAVSSAPDGETTPEQEPGPQTSETRQENAENPAGDQSGGNVQSDSRDTNGNAAGENDAQQAAAQPPADAPKTWTLRHLDEVRQVGEDEMLILAQKGMDYDRIRAKYDESKPAMELIGRLAKQAGVSISEYLSMSRVREKQSSGMNEAEARRAVELEDREAAVSAREAEEAQRQKAAEQASQSRTDAEARRQADIAEFQRAFPDAAKEPKSIPPQVWADVRSGMSLVSAYSRYAVSQARAAQQEAEQKAAAAAQNRKNEARSAGSMQSAGDTGRGKDPFMDGFDS